MEGIEQWYEEKSDYVNNTGGVTGHYEALIATARTYVGIGAFVQSDGGWCCVAGEFSRETGLDETESGLNGAYIQTVEVAESAAGTAYIDGDTSLDLGKSTQLTLRRKISFSGIMGGTNTTKACVLESAAWTSDRPDIADVSSDGTVTAKSVGQANLTATIASGSFSCTVTVTQPKKGTKLTSGSVAYKVTKQGAEVAVSGTAKKTAAVTIPRKITVDGITYKVTSVSANAFKGNKTLKKVTIGANVTKIGKNAFYGCKKLKRYRKLFKASTGFKKTMKLKK